MDGKATEFRQQPMMRSRRRSQAMIWMGIVAVCLIIAGPAVTFWLLRRGEQMESQGTQSRYIEQPDPINFHVEAIGNDSFTLAWERPEGSFDSYWITVVDSSAARSGAADHRFGSCANESKLDVDQTSLTCDQIRECTSISVTLRTLSRGPQVTTSNGVAIQGIFNPGKAPGPPRNITIVKSSPSIIRVQWDAPDVTPSAGVVTYSVDACELEAVGHPAQLCKTHETPNTSLELVITRGASYWVEVTARTLCGGDVLRSTPVGAEFASPPREVTNLRLANVGDDSFSATWDRPKGHFDYYWVDMTDERQERSASSRHHLDVCGNGTILPPDQTRVTCSNLEACANVTFRVRTHNNGPPARTSHGVALGGIFITGGAPKDFDVDAKAMNQSTYEVTLHLSNIKPCQDARCHAVLFVGSRKIPVPCQEYVGKEKTLRVTNVDRQKTYVFIVTMTSALNSKNATKYVLFRIA